MHRTTWGCVLAVLVCLNLGCAPVTAPRSTIQEIKTTSPRDTLDFSRAFTHASDSTPVRTDHAPDTAGVIMKVTVPTCMARIALLRGRKRAVLYAVGGVDISTKGDGRRPQSARGRIEIHSLAPGRVSLSAGDLGKVELSLPCTLRTRHSQSYIEVEEGTYRGSIILCAEAQGTFAVVNYLHIEDYLRGVVAKEIGRRPPEEIEAVKAQAIAARTYTYRKLRERVAHHFDLLPTVADQVYGGVGAESRLTDQAIFETAGLVITHADSLVFTYYHSTCGGKTANIEEVWSKPSAPYLTSIDDTDQNGAVFCGISPAFEWKETWSRQQLSSIAARFSREAFPTNPLEGILRAISVTERTSCGRAKTCVIATSSGIYTYGGDRIRFVLRREAKGFPILRSSAITSCVVDAGAITLTGKGYGHGVGMCQMGAVGRARAGQTYRHILAAYYRGTRIAQVQCSGK